MTFNVLYHVGIKMLMDMLNVELDCIKCGYVLNTMKIILADV